MARPILLRRRGRLAAAAGLAAALLLSACGSGQAEPAGGLTDPELRWLRSYNDWTGRLSASFEDGVGIRASVIGGTGGSRADYDRAMSSVRACLTRFRAQVGDAPTKRLETIARVVERACPHYGRAVAAESRSFVGDPGEPLQTAEEEWGRGHYLFEFAARELEEALTWNRPLPTRSGFTSTSRVEPRFGRVAEAIANREVEVRCWSARDWKTVIADWMAYADFDEEDAIGFVASLESGSLSLSPVICEALVELTYRGARPAGGEGQIAIADAVATLAHEAEHLVAPGTEADTECYAMQDIREVARALGASPSYAEGLADVYLEEIYPTLDLEYRTGACYDRGPLDRRPDDPSWP